MNRPPPSARGCSYLFHDARANWQPIETHGGFTSYKVATLASTSGRFGNPPADGCTRPCARHGGKFAAASTSNGRGGRLDVFNSSCLSHICGQRAVPCEMAGGGHSRPFGSSTMPRPASRTVAFEPEHIQAMQGAFDTVCARLKLSTGTGDRVTELVARRIIELGRAGERDANRLAARALAEFGVENDGSLWRH
jgi:hypothetical protein